MAARDKIHYLIRRALIKDGWIILADPFILDLPDYDLEVDLEAEKLMELTKENKKILVEIKSFLNLSLLPDYYEAAGQYDFYRDGVETLGFEHEVYLAISTVTYFRISQKPSILKHIAKNQIKIIVVDLNTESIVQWIE